MTRCEEVQQGVRKCNKVWGSVVWGGEVWYGVGKCGKV